MNVLLTCAGRRTYLVEWFKSAVGSEGRVLAADASADAPALRAADGAFILPRVDAPGAMDAVLDLCREQRIGLLVSLNDYELPFLAQERDRLRAIGTTAVISSKAVIDTCFDKWSTFRFLEANGLPSARTWLTPDDARRAVAAGEATWPLIVKPRWGTASLGIELAYDEAELGLAFEMGRRRVARAGTPGQPNRGTDGLIIQERLAGLEHGVDVVNDLAGRHAATLVRRKLAMRAGETDRAVTVQEPAIEAVAAVLAARLGHVGNLDVDVFLDGDRVSILEMNPRFGGGYPFSHVAGADIPAALVAWACGRDVERGWLAQRTDVRSAKFDRLVVTS